ncbi:type III PLP-dependent enzyme domain-containing protein [Sphaerisporangium corydalis]|uniref:Orn/DAP/Arg decarboxylase 2 C-terminal domain-containing protein n=1 Tax=Sphaerisporangium corydalis TaxID=1441875 RepID=A0ABV9ES26_9ACTN|nr:hypothetical protein [Sphaerisporangium corydalis]
MLQLAAAILKYARGLGVTEINIGGGMAVNYVDPDSRFDWKTYGEGLASLRRPGETLRIEPGRSLSVYCGRYVTRVIDVKRVHGELFAVVAGGTHHIRTPATKGHSQPMVIEQPGEPTTIVGQLCTPKDTMARHIPRKLGTGGCGGIPNGGRLRLKYFSPRLPYAPKACLPLPRKLSYSGKKRTWRTSPGPLLRPL